MKFTSTVRPASPDFETCVGRLEKKYPKIRADVDAELKDLVDKTAPIPWPPNVVLIPGLGQVVMKVRIASTDQGVGKRGGFRVMLVAIEGSWKPFFVYPKAERKDVPRAELLELLARS